MRGIDNLSDKEYRAGAIIIIVDAAFQKFGQYFSDMYGVAGAFFRLLYDETERLFPNLVETPEGVALFGEELEEEIRNSYMDQLAEFVFAREQ